MNYTPLKEIESTGLAYCGFTSDGRGQWHYNEPADRENYESLAALMDSDAAHFVRVRQQHTDHLLAVTAETAGEGVIRPAGTMVHKCEGDVCGLSLSKMDPAATDV